jgi:acetoin utilization protein AcuC
MTTTVYYGEELARYGFGEDHPFGPDRLAAFWNEASRQGLDRQVTIARPVQAQKRQLEMFHTADYVKKLERLSALGVGTLDVGDTPVFPGIYEAACFVAGSVIDGANRIMSGETRRVFVPIAGLHHARRDTAAGFCAVNDIGIVIEHLRRTHGVKRIAYVDIDAHHGDGVFYEFEDDPEIYVADIHEDGRYLYPGTGFAEESGTGDAVGTKINLPLTPPDTRDKDFYPAWDRIEEFLAAHKPEFIVLQAGADSIAGDPITHMQLTSAAHAHAARQLCKIADSCCDGKLLATGGGGYNRSNLAIGWSAVVAELIKD